MKIIEKIFDAQTNNETIFEREMTSDELAEFEKDMAKAAAKAQAEAETKIKRQALLEKLGITEEEAKILLG